MLREEDIVITIGRAAGGADCMNVIHKPTGIRRGLGPPLPKPEKAKRELLVEIEAEIRARGLTQYLVPDRRR